MLPEDIIQLLVDVFSYDEDDNLKEDVKRKPEEYLKSLLKNIKEELPHVWAMLKSTVEQAAADPYIKTQNEEIEREERESRIKAKNKRKSNRRKKVAL